MFMVILELSYLVKHVITRWTKFKKYEVMKLEKLCAYILLFDFLNIYC